MSVTEIGGRVGKIRVLERLPASHPTQPRSRQLQAGVLSVLSRGELARGRGAEWSEDTMRVDELLT